ncbi:hypothetical protein QIA36_05975 (plasmid) [Borreliella yangtzensis]|uniref:hypothetical protein n=1 Tax=Borreliella yangtzensis TaxID=683292 RepID=UPI003B225B3C
MNKKVIMFIICVIFALVISCKNYAISKNLENLKDNAKEKVDGFLEIKKEELTEGFKNLGSEVSSKVQGKLMQSDDPQGQAQEQLARDVNNVDQEVKELEKKLEDLKKQIEETNDKTTLKTYSEYEEELKKLEEKLKNKDKEKLENKLKELEKSLKGKIDKRKKALEGAKTKFKEFQRQVDSASGQSYGDLHQNQGKVGQEAWRESNKLGLNESYSNDNGTNSGNFAKNVIDGTLKKIEEELKGN